ncbi:uncharacterized protein MICPUCDRAFT_24770 [Micromonas pusilla CCMP1545]|uniref:Predicted protein n=1 Tax=Micromonas pusilla (strain CCMP1545) TaxID=564608 RepID=C1MKD1_MICPC|nr:uncharacterized protein MICPUCDRAFT_24770 [Micromonas pusilla CCMP1545]EEH59350.1 predicted protein [Micromonas pusilla CCMP1545]|eukprot:XP_003055974.1 predicted protein [Micromonas pusilla CCMP1545]
MSEGGATAAIYGLIRDGQHEVCIPVLEAQLSIARKSRPALSLLGYCYYHAGYYDDAATVYESLSRLHPEQPAYKTYHVQSLFKKSAYTEATKLANEIDDPKQVARVANLKAAIAFDGDDTETCRAELEQHTEVEPSAVINLGCCLLKEARPEEARLVFTDAMHRLGYHAELAYNIALCYYRSKQFGPALKHLAEIIERGAREHPELFLSNKTERGVDCMNLAEVRSVGNSTVLKQTALIEAFNLKAAIEYAMKNPKGYHAALADMPPRSEEELDPVTLHNVALMLVDVNPVDSFHKLNFLLLSPSCPPETCGNLLMLYCKPEHAFYDLAADVLAANKRLVEKYLPRDTYDYVTALIMSHLSPEDAYLRLDILNNKHMESLRMLTRTIHGARAARDAEAVKQALLAYDDALELYVPILMSKAKIYWDIEHYNQVEQIFKAAAEHCSEHEAWRLNVAHVFFMQSLQTDEKYAEAIAYYEPIVRQHEPNLLECTAIVLANLCVAYIMTSQNEQAEELMRRIEQDEFDSEIVKLEARNFHLCIVNLVIGTLYCTKGNYAFGISRVMKSLEPFPKRLDSDTWFYAKRCFLSLIDQMTKRILSVGDETLEEINLFLDSVERHGKHVLAFFKQPSFDDVNGQTVSNEARVLKTAFLKLRGL